MPRVVSYEDAKRQQFTRRGSLRTPFINSDATQELPSSRAHNVDFPVAFLSQGAPNRVIESHYHLEDEFLLVAGGSGVLGRHHVEPYTVFFARAHTPYGPLVGAQKTGIEFFVLSARFETGAQYIPEKSAELKRIPDRHPWQIARHVELPPIEARVSSPPVHLQAVPDITDNQGLFASTLSIAPDATAAGPDPSHGDGQFLIVVQGSLWYDSKEHKAYTVVFVRPDEGAFRLRAGPQGLQAIIMNFPEVKARSTEQAAPSVAAGFKKWQCELCAFAYDEALGLPDDGIAAGTRWQDVPESWTCPDCGASKADFKMAEVG